MPVLYRRFFRIIRQSLGQFIALTSIVMLGVLVYIAMNTAFLNLSKSQEDFYTKSKFADYYINVIRAPQAILRQIENLPGVMQAKGRVQQDIVFLKSDAGRGTLRVTSYNLPMENELNQIQIKSGRIFGESSDHGIEILVDPQFAQANNLKPGSIIKAIAEGKEYDLYVVGTAISPEFIYVMKDSSTMLPDPKEFGTVMMAYDQAVQILGFENQYNQFILALGAGTDVSKLENSIKSILKPYGNLSAYPRKDQLSHSMLDAELHGLEMSSKYTPLLFFLIAAGFQFLLLGRVIKNQRTSIGILKALGYDNVAIIWHYILYAIAVSVLGSILGSVFGVMLASVFSQVYAMYFNLPTTIGGLNIEAIIMCFMLTTSIGVLSGLLACRQVLRIQPAIAMRSQAPLTSGKKIVFEKFDILWDRLSTSWHMTLRSMIRNRYRFIVTISGVISCAVILTFGFFTNDSIDFMLNKYFTVEKKYDVLVTFTKPLPQSSLLDLIKWDEIMAYEGVLQIPVRMWKSNTDEDFAHEEDGLLQGMSLQQKMVGITSPENNQMMIPEEGVLLNEKIANKLNVRVGDSIEIETQFGYGPKHRSALKIVGLSQSLMGGGSYVSLATANRIIGENNLVTSTLLQTKPDSLSIIKEQMKLMTNISSIVSSKEEKDNWNTMMASMVYFVTMTVAFAGVIGMAIAYNSALMNFNERQRELATFRVIGFTNRELAGLLFKETAIQSIIGVIIGLPLGKILGVMYIQAISTDIYTMPVVIYGKTYLLVAIMTLAFMIAGFCLVVPKIKKLDYLDALKNKD